MNENNEDNPYAVEAEILDVAPPAVPPESPANVGVRTPMSATGYLSWAFVTVVVAFLVTMVAWEQISNVNEIGGDATSGDLMQVQLIAKNLVSQKNMSKVLPVGNQPEPEIPIELDKGCYEQRLCYAILLNEVKGVEQGPGASLEYLEELDTKVEAANLPLTENQEALRMILADLLDQYDRGDMDASSIPQSDRDLLIERLGFCGELLLLPDGTPNKDARDALVGGVVVKLIVAGIAVMGGLLFGFVGVVTSIVLLLFFKSGKLSLKMETSKTNPNIYIETFAIWMALFFGSSILLGAFVGDAKTQMILQPFIFFGSLVCLVWPVVRGVPFDRVREDIGWKAKSPIYDLLSAPIAYAATLPMLIPGFIVVVVASSFLSLVQEQHEFARQAAPGHPIQEFLSSGDWLMIVMVFIAACVAAPIVEETIFRGILYRHLRDASSRFKKWMSIAISVTLNGFIFAAIHPQGILAIPILMTLAICFSLAREWRGSLYPSMVMHGIHNFAITCISLVVL